MGEREPPGVADRRLSVLVMKTYQIDYFQHGVWNPGLIIRMKPEHLPRYLECVNGERPIALNGRTITKEKRRCLPTRIRCIAPNWRRERGYYHFDGKNLRYVTLRHRP